MSQISLTAGTNAVLLQCSEWTCVWMLAYAKISQMPVRTFSQRLPSLFSDSSPSPKSADHGWLSTALRTVISLSSSSQLSCSRAKMKSPSQLRHCLSGISEYKKDVEKLKGFILKKQQQTTEMAPFACRHVFDTRTCSLIITIHCTCKSKRSPFSKSILSDCQWLVLSRTELHCWVNI